MNNETGDKLMKLNKTATSQDVAKLAGVSQSAVSRSFTKGASISSRTKLRVLEAAKKLRYKAPNISSNVLSNEDSGLVGVILPYVTSRYYPEVLTELHEALKLGGFRILLITTDEGEELDEKLVKPYLKEKLIAIVSAIKPTESFVESCNSKRIQFISYNRCWNIPTLSSVACDHKNGGEMIAEYFMKNNHKKIGLIEGPKDSFVSDQRIKGFKQYYKNNKNIKIFNEKGFFTYDGGYQAAQKVLKNKDISAIFCADDTMAFGCLDYIKKNTILKIPKDLEIIGYDDISMSNWKSYDLTTVRQPIRQMSKLVTQLIDEYIRDPDYESINHIIQGSLIKRKTTR
ncbi:LacI family transcriptional regulator [bacterium]|nr:LacI family transcriptional regulator [bacterium]